MTLEDHRYEVRRYLYSVAPTAADAIRIQHGLARLGIKLTEHEITGAAMFLSGLPTPQVEIHRAALGSSQSFQITSAGQLAYERNE
jgi:hypothetical protein